MHLLVDSGNSRLKWSWWAGGELFGRQGVAGGKRLSIETLDTNWGAFVSPPNGVWIANVAGAGVAALLARWIESRWGLEPVFVTSQAEDCGVTNGYDNPERLGVDRWLALIGAFHHYPLPACIVDCGTALTLDVLDRQGRHRGGLISPGLALMTQSLGKGTADIGLDVAVLSSKGRLGRETSQAIGLGIRHAAAGLIERVMEDMATELPDLRLILTGGDAGDVAAFLRKAFIAAPELVLQGLAVVSQEHE